mgnify:CR=1 FL=1
MNTSQVYETRGIADNHLISEGYKFIGTNCISADYYKKGDDAAYVYRLFDEAFNPIKREWKRINKGYLVTYSGGDGVQSEKNATITRNIYQD